MDERSPDEQIGDAVIRLGCLFLVAVLIVAGLIATIIKVWVS
jgi:hypothetical protein